MGGLAMGCAGFQTFGRRRSRLRRCFNLLHSVCLLLLILTIAASDGGTDTADVDSAATGISNDEVLELVTSIEVALPAKRVHARRKKVSSEVVEDRNEGCADWAAQGECEANPDYMLENCAASCSDSESGDNDNGDNGSGEQNDDIVAEKGTAFIYQGEDAAIGAFRFAERYTSYYENEVIPISTVLDIARELQQSLTSSSSGQDYTPSTDVTHCGGESDNKKSRPCSAGKLWKRAEDMRKAELYDAAGADLIRALLKSGTEVDFVEKCERSLQWAFVSVRKQREREHKLALEEAKLEKRRMEEMEAMAEAEERKKEYEANFVTFGKRLQESLLEGSSSEAAIGADGSVESTNTESQLLITNVIQTFTAAGPQGGNWSETLQLIKKVSPSDKTEDILLIEARCHEMEGNHKQALSAAGKLIAKAANHEPWLNDSPRMMATTLGSNAAMQLGLSENAISFYQNVLKFDPEQERARKQYRGLKKVVKLLDKAEEQIQKGYNNAASEFVTDSLSAMRGLDVDSPLFRSKIQLKRCTILSSMGKYEEALENCDQAVELRLANESVVSAESRKEAHLARAEALLLDMDYDEAVSDLRAAFDLVPEDQEHMQEKRQLQQKLQQAMHQQKLWNGGEKDYRFNENTGYPDGRPPERDHAKILQLPIDLDQRTKDIKCAWLKKQFKALVRQYHPDKYKGNKKRAARKFKEVKEAKEIISSAWDC